jgi:hypothetical protein
MFLKMREKKLIDACCLSFSRLAKKPDSFRA